MTGKVINANERFQRKNGEDWVLCPTCVDKTLWGVIAMHNATGSFITTLVCLECFDCSNGVQNGYLI